MLVLFAIGQTRAVGISPSVYSASADAAPAIVTSRTHLYMYTAVGNASPPVSFNIAGTDMQEGITVVPAPGNSFEYSTDNVNFSNSPISIGAAGNIAQTVLYVRLRAGLQNQTVTGPLKLTSAGMADVFVMLHGNVNNPPSVINLTVNAGDVTPINFPGTSCLSVWQNDNPAIGLPSRGAGNITSFKAVNTSTSPLHATIKTSVSAQGIAYIGNITARTISLIDIASNMVVETVQLPSYSFPTSITVSPDGSRLFIDNSGSVSVLTVADNQLKSTFIYSESNVANIAVSPDAGKLYVPIYNRYIGIYNTVTSDEVGRINLVANGPLIFSRDGTKIYATDNNAVYIINAATNTIISTINGVFSPRNLVLSPDGNQLYIVNGAYNKINILNTATGVINTITPFGTEQPLVAIIHPDGSKLYVGTNLGNVKVISTATGGVIANVVVGGGPSGLSISPDGGQVYSVDATLGVVVINTANNTVLTNIAVGANSYSKGNAFTSSPFGCEQVIYNITVNPPPPSIVVTPVTGSITADVGAVSASPNIQQFKLSGSYLLANATVTAPAGFEVSVNPANGYANSITLAPSGVSAVINNTTVYVRAKAATVPGIISGNVTIVSGALSKNLAVIGGINQTVNYGATTTAVNFPGCLYYWFSNRPDIGLKAPFVGNIAAFMATNDGNVPITATIFATPPTYAYVPYYSANKLQGVNLSDKSTRFTIPLTMQQPAGITVNADNSRIYVATASGVSILNATDQSLITTVGIPTGANDMRLTPDGSKLYVSCKFAPAIYVIDTKTNAIITNTAVNYSPGKLAADPDGEWIYHIPSNNNIVQLIRVSDNALVRSINVGSPGSSIAVSPDGKILYVGNSSGQLRQVVISSGVITRNATLPAAVASISITLDNRRVYTANQAKVSVFNTDDLSLIANITLPQPIANMAISSDGKLLYALADNGHIFIINTVDNALNQYTPGTGDAVATSGNFMAYGPCPPVSFTITVNPSPPTVITAGTPVALTGTFGTASVSTSFKVSGKNVGSDVLITPPTGFELSLDNAAYTPTITLPVYINLAETTVYIRLAATNAVGTYGGNIVFTAANAPTINLAMPSSTINKAPLTIKLDDVTKTYGQVLPLQGTTTAFTITTGALQNGDLIQGFVVIRQCGPGYSSGGFICRFCTGCFIKR